MGVVVRSDRRWTRPSSSDEPCEVPAVPLGPLPVDDRIATLKASIAVHKTKFEDDARLLLKGAPVCSNENFCLRPSGHLGECGSVLSPVWKRP